MCNMALLFHQYSASLKHLQVVQALRRSNTRYFSKTTATRQSKKAVFLNAGRLDYDGKLDFTRWFNACGGQENVVLNQSNWLPEEEKVLELVQDAEIVITKEVYVSTKLLQDFPSSVKLLCEAGTGYNNLPIVEARARNILVCNVPTYSTDAVAHMAITYMMNFSCSMFDQQRMLLENDRGNFTGPFTLPLTELNGKTVGLIGGAGRIGTTVAKVSLALGMKVMISSRKGVLPDNHDLFGNPNVVCTSSVDDVLRAADYVSLHTPLNDQTRGTFGRKQIELMKPTAFLINTSRGAVCNEKELIECMQERLIAGAGLDVTTTEPPPPDSVLWDLPNVWLTPHTGWRRIETRQRLVDMTADNIEAYCKAESEADMINVVN